MERIHVAVRARPLSPEDSKTSPWKISGNSISLVGQPTKFEFDKVFGENSRTVDVYESKTKDIVASAVRGFNGTVFAYGQTSSGKTHTMRGTVDEPGIIPLAVYDLFQSIQEDEDREFLLRMSYMEIYNEEVNDLLAPEHRRLQIHENLERGIYVAGLREEIVASSDQVLDLMEFAHRHIGETNMNLYSSRSHTIFRMIVESREKIQDGDVADYYDAVRVSVLNLVDLAGSERAAKTGAEGMRLKEGSHINKSLMTLGSVIKKLSEGAESQGGHVPYRDSKLTRILQPSLGGNANTAIICNITLAQVHTDETKSSLQFASRALRVQNCACVNEILTDAALLKRQRKEIEELRAKLLASHSDHWEEEILNLRNTLLTSELEKERIALELEEEKKAKAKSEIRLQEQEKKIENLSSLVLFSERDEKSYFVSKGLRLDQNILATNLISDKRDMGLLVPFGRLQESLVLEDLHSSNKSDDCDDLPTPDTTALLHVTSRRKIRCNRTEPYMGTSEMVTKEVNHENHISEHNDEGILQNTDFESIRSKLQGSECTTGGTGVSSCLSATSSSCNNLTVRESEAISVIKQLEDKIKSLELEKTFVQRQLDDVVELATKQNSSFIEKCEELHQEVVTSQGEARMAQDQLLLVPFVGTLEKELHSSIDLTAEIIKLASEVNFSINSDTGLSTIMEDVLPCFSAVAEMLMELKSFARQDLLEANSIINKYGELHSCMKKKVDQLEFEKNALDDQLKGYQKQTDELKPDHDNWEQILAERDLEHDMEKDELLNQILNLQKEVSLLSLSSLAREKEALRKDLDKAKSKLKDTESKLKNTIQDKIKLESDKAHVEKELKQLHGQKALLERDIRKRDSIIDRRHESRLSELNKPKGFSTVVEQNVQEDYHKLEVYAFELEAQIAILQEELLTAIGEKEEVHAQKEILQLELELMTSKFTNVNPEKELQDEEIAMLKNRLAESEWLSKKLEASLDLLAKEKEDMAMQLTDALLEVEAERCTWLAKEKSFVETKEKEKISHDNFSRLSEDFQEAKSQLESSREECARLRNELAHAEESAQREKEQSMQKTSENSQLMDKLSQSTTDRAEMLEMQSNFQLLSSKHQLDSEEIQKLQSQINILCQQKDELHCQLERRNKGKEMVKDIQDHVLALFDVPHVATEVEVIKKNYEDTLSNARSNVDELQNRISSLEVKMHNVALEKGKYKTKLRMQLQSTQGKLDAYRNRYKELVDEMKLMNNKYEEASSKLKEQLATYGHEILRLKKELKTKEQTD